MPIRETEPETVRAHYVTGLTQLGGGEVEAAIGTMRDVLTLDPFHAGARRNLVRALLAAREFDQVIAETALTSPAASGSAELHFLRGTAFNALSRPIEARDALTIAITLNPNFAPAWLNLGNALMDLDDMIGAETNCRRALHLDPTLIEAHISLGFILTAQGRVAEGIGALEEAIRIDPANVQAHWNLAAAALLDGDLPRGFKEYEWRKRHDLFRHDFIGLPGPVWDGGDPAGMTILVHAEQGFGDTIQFARYLTLIALRGGRPVLACDPCLIPLLATMSDVHVVSKFEPLPRYDAWIDQMSLPRIFGTALDTIPFASGYLIADPKRVATHRAGLPPMRCVGLAWSGNSGHRNDRRRTPPKDAFAPLLLRPDLCVVSLIPNRTLPNVAYPPRPLTDYAETAALIAALDLVITVDTSVAHLAGALGCPARVLLPYAPDWRWLRERNDMPWYGSLRLIRQPSPGDWHSVIAAALAG